MVSTREKAVPDRETDNRQPFISFATRGKPCGRLSPLWYRLLFPRLPSFAHRLAQFWTGQTRGDDLPWTTHLASGLPASLDSHWLAGFLGRVAVGHRSGPLLNGATAQWPQLSPLLPSRFGWASLWWVGLHRLSLSLSLLLVLLIPDQITAGSYYGSRT